MWQPSCFSKDAQIIPSLYNKENIAQISGARALTLAESAILIESLSTLTLMKYNLMYPWHTSCEDKECLMSGVLE